MKNLSYRQLLLILTLCFATIWFSTIDYRSLVKPDEGRYSEIPREMAVSGDWITPRLNGIKYFEKPPLQYWATASVYSVFGFTEGSARLWTALTGFLTILTIYFTGRKLFSESVGFYAGLILTSSLLFSLMGHVNTLDMGVTCFMTISLCGLLLALHEKDNIKHKNNYLYVMWGGLALSVLSKGLMGIILPGAVLFLYCVFKRDFKIILKLQLIKGLLLFFAITAPWFIAVSIQNPEFAHFFFIHEHFERFLTKAHRREGGWYYFIPILTVGFLPWIVPLFYSLFHHAKLIFAEFKSKYENNDSILLLSLWSGFIFFFFSISSSKLPSYILPIFPALSLLLAIHIESLSKKVILWSFIPLSIGLLASSLGVKRLENLANDQTPAVLYLGYKPWLFWAIGIAVVGLIAGSILLIKQHRKVGVVLISLTSLIASQLTLLGHHALAESKSSVHIAEAIKPHLHSDTKIYNVNYYDQPLPFYLQRTMTLVNFRDELDFGLKQEPHLWIESIEQFKTVWNQKQKHKSIAVMTKDSYESLKTQIKMKVIIYDAYRVVVIQHDEL